MEFKFFSEKQMALITRAIEEGHEELKGLFDVYQNTDSVLVKQIYYLAIKECLREYFNK